MKALITGSSGLIGSETVKLFDKFKYDVVGIDNNARKKYFGSEGDTTSIQNELNNTTNYKFCNIDLTSLNQLKTVTYQKFDLVIHCAGQPSHDKSGLNPIEDFQANALGTLNLLDEIRRNSPNAVFIYTSSNKVYGDGPNYVPMVEKETRWEYENKNGINSKFNIDRSKIRTPFGVSKLSADYMVQEYRNYYGLKTVVLRLGCVTGPTQKGVELHGFLNYLCKCAKEGKNYNIYGYKGKQVRDIIHAYDVARAFYQIYCYPPKVSVFNLGGGYENSCSIIEAISMIEKLTKIKMKTTYIDEPRKGDHKIYITDYKRFKNYFPNWRITKNLREIMIDLLFPL